MMSEDSMNRAAFEAVVQETLDALPKHIREGLNDVAIVIEERPPDGRKGLLLGLYEGIPLTEWGRGGFSGKLPDKITLFMEPIITVAGNPEEVPHVIRETLWHEIAHYFGYDHGYIRTMERRWRTKRNKKG